MVNREKVEEFCKASEKEEQAAVDIVVVFDEGEIIQYHLESMNGKINVRLCQVKWKDNSPQANYYDEYEAYEWKYTEKRILVFWRNITHRDLMEHRVKLDSECSH